MILSKLLLILFLVLIVAATVIEADVTSRALGRKGSKKGTKHAKGLKHLQSLKKGGEHSAKSGKGKGC
ncbi:hypothetical protein TrLO_g12424 [Triparma laevis f. longispina]|uniref:Uncharacterized protein n=1 Tax=Triparma laevis f. longispina TaxID=1714387 RepID=A0A9W6ZT20_9STRA|nr:hypothetical protein TrLO_g12424 [Triparma laevis f. longispina]